MIVATVVEAEYNGLTPREIDVLKGVKEFKTNKEIGAGILLSERTIKFHVSNLLAKANVQGRNELIGWRGIGNAYKSEFHRKFSLLSEVDKLIIQYITCNLTLSQVDGLVKLNEAVSVRIPKIFYVLELTKEKIGVSDSRYELVFNMLENDLIPPDIRNFCMEIKKHSARMFEQQERAKKRRLFVVSRGKPQ